MTADRRALLDAIGFSWDPGQARWMRRYRQLTDAITRHGSPENLPAESPEATWLEGQLLARHRGKLPEARIALLEQAGISVSQPDTWPAAFQALIEFKAEHGHLRIPDRYKTAGGFALSDWQRQLRARRKKHKLTDDQARLLDEAGFCWDPLADAWHARYEELCAWKREHGHLGLPRKHPLRQWLDRQRNNHRQGHLPSDCAGLLHDLGALDGAD